MPPGWPATYAPYRTSTVFVGGWLLIARCYRNLFNLLDASRIMLLPGLGEPLDECLLVKGYVTCPEGHFKRAFRSSCQRIECPECFHDWARKAGHRISELLRGVRAAYWHTRRAEYGKVRSFRHIVFSPPPGSLDDACTLDDAFGLFMAMYEAHKPMHGGVVLFHPYRLRKDVQGRLEAYMKERGDYYDRCPESAYFDTDMWEDGGYWDLARADVLGIGSLDCYYHFSPHYHVLGFGYLPKVDEFYQVTGGWVYVNLKNRRPTIYENEKTGVLVDEVQNTAKYQLSHAGVERGKGGKFRDAYRRFGICSVSRARLVRLDNGSNVIRLVKESVLKCPICGKRLTAAVDSEGELSLSDHDLVMLEEYGIYAVFMRKSYRSYEVNFDD